MTPATIRAVAGDRRIGFVSGNFNILHPGHLRLLRFAAENCDFLVVGVNPENAPGTTLPAALRLEGVQALSLVDCALLLPGSAAEFIAALRPGIVVKGKEFETRDNPELAALAGHGGRLLFSSGEVRFASLDLLRREYLGVPAGRARPRDYPERHGFRPAALAGALDRIAGLRVVVVGDLIVDTYIDCEALGMSQEDPTIVVSPLERRSFVGGAGIVAAHAAGLGGSVRYLSIAGTDPTHDFAATALAGYGVAATLLPDPTRPTTLKERYRAAGKTLLRVNHLRQHALDTELADRLVAEAVAALASADLLVFADFNYGCLPQPVVDAIAAAAQARGVMMAADSQASSQLSDISRFRGMDLITPTEREARLAMRDFADGLVVVAEALRQAAAARNIIVTLGAEGLLLHIGQGQGHATDRLPAFNTNPRDVAGAGDSLLIGSAMALRAGMDIWQAAWLGNAAAACQVSRVGNLPLSREELSRELRED